MIIVDSFDSTKSTIPCLKIKRATGSRPSKASSNNRYLGSIEKAKDMKTCFTMWKDLCITNKEPYSLIGLIASQFRFMYEVKYLYTKRYLAKDIADYLRANEYRVSKTLETLNKYMKRNNVIAEPETTADAVDALDVVAALRKQKNGAKFCKLYDDGDYSDLGSHSEADASLCSMIAFRTGPNPMAIDEIFRGSALYREKWEIYPCFI